MEISKDSGELASPLYPKRLLTGQSFTWRISVKFGNVMLLTFQDFLLQFLESGLCATSLKVQEIDPID